MRIIAPMDPFYYYDKMVSYFNRLDVLTQINRVCLWLRLLKNSVDGIAEV